MARRNPYLSARERRQLRRELDRAFAGLSGDRYAPPKPIEWAAPPPPITEERRQANLARSAEIRTALRSYLEVR